MKAEKVLGVVACAVACVASVNAFADQIAWFDGKVNTTTTSAISVPTNASWNATLPDGVTLANGSISLDNDSSTALILTPSGSEPALSDQVVTISSTAVLTPNDASDLGDVADAKAGFAVGVSNNGADTNFYGYASGLASGSRWVKLSGENPTESATTVSIVLDYRADKKKVKFVVGSTQLESASDSTVKEWAIDSEAASLSNVAAYGSGSLSALSATCEKAVVAIGDVKYGSVADAEANGGDASNIKVVNNSGEVVNKVKADNGLSAAVCAALGLNIDDKDANIAVAPAATDTNPSGITLAVNVAGAPEPGAVRYKVEGGSSEVQYYDANSVTIPLAAGTYTITPVLK